MRDESNAHRVDAPGHEEMTVEPLFAPLLSGIPEPSTPAR